MIVDPCGHDPTPEQRVNCAANGVPGGSYVQSDNDIHLVSAGGNPALEPEQGHSFNVGVEWEPVRERWNLRADYFQTRLDDFISAREPELILAECVNQGAAVACDNIERFEDGSLDSIDTRKSNFGRVTVAGIDLAAQLHVPVRGGDVGARLIATHLLEHESQIFEGGTTISNAGRANGGMLLPRWRALGGVDWTHGDWQSRVHAAVHRVRRCLFFGVGRQPVLRLHRLGAVSRCRVCLPVARPRAARRRQQFVG